jgi:hypothetical protein
VTAANAVSRPVVPIGACSNGDLLLVARVRGVVGRDAVDRPVAQALDQRLAVGPRCAAAGSSSARVEARGTRLVGERRWCGRASQLIRTPRALACATASTDSRALRCWMWIAPVLVAGERASRAIIVDSLTLGMPVMPASR